MKFLKRISQHEMIASFLKTEITSPRFGPLVNQALIDTKIDKKIILKPNLRSKKENLLRSRILAQYRGWGTNDNLFIGFPKDVIWKRALLSKSELKNIKYINREYWYELSSGTGFAKYALKKITKGIKTLNQNNRMFNQAAKALQEGKKFPELILVAPSSDSTHIVLEGHLRLTAYLLAYEHTPNEIEVIVGYSPKMTSWIGFVPKAVTPMAPVYLTPPSY